MRECALARARRRSSHADRHVDLGSGRSRPDPDRRHGGDADHDLPRAEVHRASAGEGVRSADLFFFNDTATTEIYTLSLHDALPISPMAKVDATRHYGADVELGGTAL